MPFVPVAWAEGLLAAGVQTVFGVAGSANFAMLARYREIGGHYVAALHESGAMAMATGSAASGRSIGIASVHQGPGLTNAITALVDAGRSGLPVALICGHVGERDHHQWIDSVALANSLEVPVVSPGPDAEDLHSLLRGMRDTGNAVLVLPPGLAAEAVAPPRPTKLASIPGTIMEAVSAARHIAIIAGRGAVRSGAVPLLTQLGDHLDALLVTTAPALGAFAGNPRAAGITGGFATRGTSDALRDCDVVLAFGASLDHWSTAGGRLFDPNARVISFGLDSKATVRMDASLAARGLLEDVAARSETGWARSMAEQARAAREYAPGDELDPRALLAVIDTMLPPQRQMSFDSGHFLAIAAMTMTSIGGPWLQFGQDFQSVGLGLAHAIGASVEDPSRITAAVIGDGGAAMSILELAVAVDLRLPLVVVVVNDGGYGAEVHDFEPLGMPVSIAQTPRRDWAGVARALGANAVTVHALTDLDGLRSWLQAPAGPLLLDCHVDERIDAVSIMTDEGRAEWSHPE